MIPVIDIQYLPPIAYFVVMKQAGSIMIEACEHFEKQTYRNRCYIKTVQGVDSLIVPVKTGGHKITIKDTRVDYSQKWLNNHWRTIQSAYGSAPFFEYYAGDLERVLFQRYQFLYDLNYNLLSLCLDWLQWQIPLKETLSYNKLLESNFVDYRSLISPKKADFVKKIYEPVPYYQVFGNTFAENLSLIDLIFCKGPEASRIITTSTRRG